MGTGLPFVQLSTKFWSDDDLMISWAARGLFASLLSYCGDLLTDGRVTTRGLSRVTAGSSPEEAAALMSELCDQGVVSVIDDGWMIVNYTRWNTTKEKVEEKRRASAKASRTYRERQRNKGDGDTAVTDESSRRDQSRDPSVIDLEKEIEIEEEVTNQSPGLKQATAEADLDRKTRSRNGYAAAAISRARWEPGSTLVAQVSTSITLEAARRCITYEECAQHLLRHLDSIAIGEIRHPQAWLKTQLEKMREHTPPSAGPLPPTQSAADAVGDPGDFDGSGISKLAEALANKSDEGEAA